MTDYHLHLYPHRRGESSPLPPDDYPLAHIEQFVSNAAIHGVTELAFTEHLYRCVESTAALGAFWEQADNPNTGGRTEADVRADRTMSLERYVAAILRAKDAGLPVLLGLEVDFIPGTVEAVLELIAPYPWDVLIGSVHWIDGWWFDRKHSIDEWDRRGARRVYEQFFALETELADAGIVDVLAHVDRVKYQGQRLAAPPLDLYETVVKAARRADVAIELSSAGLRHPIAEVYPAPALLEMFREADLAITFASDGHFPDQAGWGHDDIRRIALATGYTHTARFRARKRHLIPIVPS
jgi:histidinol-phosphatase (PHP family)